MTPNQPYLIRAYYEWIVDNDLTPHLAVDAQQEGVEVPREHVKDGQIILNVSPSACGDMQMGNEWIMFNARFSGASRRLIVPVTAVLAIFARENGAGTVFMQPNEQEQASDDSIAGIAGNIEDSSVGKSAVEKSVFENNAEIETKTTTAPEPIKHSSGVSLKSIGGDDKASSEPVSTDKKPPRPKGKPSLKVIK